MKIKSRSRKDVFIVDVKLAFAEKISDRDILLLQNKKNANCFFEITKRSRRHLIYSGPQCTSLKQYLEKYISKFEFYLLIEQILEIIKKAKDNDLKLRNIVLDMNNMYINIPTKELYCIYLPIHSDEGQPDFLGFIRNIMSRICVEEDLKESIVMFSSFINSNLLQGFDVKKIEKFISGEDFRIDKRIKMNNYQKSGFLTDKPGEHFEHYDGIDEENMDTDLMNGTMDMEAECGTGLMDATDMEYGTGLMDGTTDMEIAYGTGLMEENGEVIIPQKGLVQPKIERISTREVIEIDKNVFLLGRNRDSEGYNIADNVYVARRHAEIIIRGMQCFVCDLDSANHTYINNKVLYPGQEQEIKNGDVLKLADEEFIFRWDR